MFVITRKNGYSLKAETSFGAKAALEQMRKCGAKSITVETKDGLYMVQLSTKGDRWYKSTQSAVDCKEEFPEEEYARCGCDDHM